MQQESSSAFLSVACDEKNNPDHTKTTIEPTRASPAAAMPVVAVPTVSAPAPMTPVPVPVPVAVMPANLFGFEPIDVFLRDHRGFGVSAWRRRRGRLGAHRRQW